jgi:hypothetical protein
VVTPPLSGTILPGITPDAIMTLARKEGRTVREERGDYCRDHFAAGCPIFNPRFLCDHEPLLLVLVTRFVGSARLGALFVQC